MQNARARVIEVLHEDRHGCAETASGLAVHFHELSVAGGLSCLAVGDEVTLTLDDSSPDACSVQRTGRRWE